MGGVLNAVSNLVIVAGYLLVPALWLPYLPLTKPVLIAGAVFFVTCALTHLGMVFHLSHLSPWLIANHVVQAVAVMLFVAGFGRLLREAHERQEELKREEL